MYNGIGLQTARGSGTNGYIQTNKFFIKPKTNKLTSKSSYEETGGQGQGSRPNKEILEHDRKREIELKLAVLEDKLIEQGYTDDEIAVKLHEARNTLQSADTVIVFNPHHNHHHKYSDTQTHQVAARKEKQMEKLKNALGIKFHEDDAKNAKIDDDGDNKAENTCKKTDGGFDEKDTKDGLKQYKKKTKKRRAGDDSSDSDSDSSRRENNVKVSNKKKSRGRSDTESSDSDVDIIRKNRKKLVSSKHKSKSTRHDCDTKKHVGTVKRYRSDSSDSNASSDNDSDSDVDKYHRTRQLEDKRKEKRRESKVEKDIYDRWDGDSSKRDVRGGTTHGKDRHDDTDDDEDDIHHKKKEVERRRHGRDTDKRLKERETVRGGRNEDSDRKDIKSGERRHHIEDQRKTERDNVERDGRKRHDVDLEPFDKNIRRGEKRQREHKKERVEGGGRTPPHDSDDDIDDARRTKHNVFLRDAGRKPHREELDKKEIRTGGQSGVEENEKGRVESDDDDIKHTRVDRGGNKQEDVLNYKNSTKMDEKRHRSKTSSDDEDDKYLEGRKEEDGRGRKHKRDEEDDEKKPEKGRKLRESKYSREHERRRGDRDDRYADDSKRTRYDGGRSRH